MLDFLIFIYLLSIVILWDDQTFIDISICGPILIFSGYFTRLSCEIVIFFKKKRKYVLKFSYIFFLRYFYPGNLGVGGVKVMEVHKKTCVLILKNIVVDCQKKFRSPP